MESIEDKRPFGIDVKYLKGEWKSIFNRKTVVFDIWAGITVALVALPLNLALAIAAGVEPGVGITTGIVAGIIGSLMGGTRYAITGPAAAMAVVLIEIAQTYGIRAIWMVGMLAGVMQIIAGAFRLGKLIAYIPMPVVVGFANAIGILVICNSLDDLLGLPTKPIAHAGSVAPLAGHPLVPEFIQDVSHLFFRLIVHQEANIQAIGIGVLVIIIAVAVPRWTKMIPGQLVAIVVASLVAAGLGFKIPRIIDIATIPSTIPLPSIPSLPWEQMDVLFSSAITVFLLGSIESLLSASVADGMTMSRRHHSDQELLGQGIANVVVPFFGGIPVTGVIARTAVNIRAGAKTRLSGVVHSFALLGLTMLLARYAEQIPLSALGGILILTGFRLLEVDQFKQIWRASRPEAWVVIVTTTASVLMDLNAGVITGLMLTCGMFIKKMSEVRILADDAPDRRAYVREPMPTCTFVRTFLVDGPLFFGAAERFTETILFTQNLKAIILHMRAVYVMDLTGAETLLSIHTQLARNGVELIIAELPEANFELLRKIGAVDKIGPANFYESYSHALAVTNKKMLESICHGCSAVLTGTPGSGGTKDCQLRHAMQQDKESYLLLLNDNPTYQSTASTSRLSIGTKQLFDTPTQSADPATADDAAKEGEQIAVRELAKANEATADAEQANENDAKPETSPENEKIT